ncbi:nuA3 HAT complex component nto1 [Didymella keratinophila]|nr:nuA3 HAT complex component nto1 [Didymella keratinophila]
MAPVPDTPNTRIRSSERPRRRRISDSVPASKKRKYVPGGPGGGGRYVDDEGIETPVGGTGPGGYAYIGPRGRIGRLNAERQGVVLENLPSASSPSYSRPRRERPPAGPRSSSAAAVAAAVAQNDGYKPREERSWDEFHPDLDVDAEFPVYTADQIDGISPAESLPGTPARPTSSGQYAIDNGISAMLDGLRAQQTQDEEAIENGYHGSVNLLATPKRRPGRPPRNRDSMLAGLGSPPRPRIQPLPTMNPREKLNLPKPSVREVDPFKAHEESEGVKVNYVDRTMASIGYQESEVFTRAENHLIRLPEGSIEEDLDLTLQNETEGASAGVQVGRVEYDMDEQDDMWLEALNVQRKAEEVEAIKPAIFEVTITQIEKEWHALEKRIPKPNPKPPQTHRPRSSSAAAVNGEPAGQGEEQDTKFHQECYGVPFIPEGQWLCRRCQLVGRGTPASELPGCIFCPNGDGAFKQTTAMKWAHLLCAMWIPEVSLGNVTFQEPVQDVEKVPKTRWKLSCYICKQKMGACIQCGHKSCFEAFHVTCARKARLCLRMKSSQSSNPQDSTVLKAYCDRHTPSDWRREYDVEGAIADAKAFYRHTMRNIRWPDSQAYALSIGSTHAAHTVDDEDDGVPGSNKRKRGQPTKSWRLPSGAPVVPQAVYHNVENALIKFNIRKRKEFVQEACKYWTLKREARRGAALLKRLQLQMEAFSSMEITRRNFAGMGAAGRPRLQRRIEFAERLEDDMEQIRVLCYNIKEREAMKLDDVMILKNILDCVYFPIPAILRPILKRLQNLDSKDAFAEGFAGLQTKLDEMAYTSVQAFNEDLLTMLSAQMNPAPVSSAEDADDESAKPTSQGLTSEQKESKKLIKRIIRSAQPAIEDAMRKEAELARAPIEKLPDLETILQQKLQGGQDASSVEDAPHETIETDEGGHDDCTDTTTNGADRAEANKKTDDIQLAPTPDDNAADSNHSIHDEAADEAAIAAQLGQDALRVSNGERSGDAMEVDIEDTNEGTEPLTPPRSEKNLLNPLHNGGIPWYLEPFDIRGTTVYEPVWAGREVLKAMSEDLSELDDDELDGLAGSDPVQPDEDAADAQAIELRKAAARKRQRRSRAYR